MSYEPKPGTFNLFKNDRKESDSHPDYKGDGADINGNPVLVSAWLKKTKDGKTYLSGTMKLKEAKVQDKPQAPKPAGGGDFDDDIPFMRRTSNYSF